MADSSSYFFSQCEKLFGKHYATKLFEIVHNSYKTTYHHIHVIDEAAADYIFGKLNKIYSGKAFFCGFHALGSLGNSTDRSLKILPVVQCNTSTGMTYYIYSMYWCYDVLTFAQDFSFEPKMRIFRRKVPKKIEINQPFDIAQLCDDTFVCESLFRTIVQDAKKGKYLNAFKNIESPVVSFTELGNQIAADFPHASI